MTLQVDFWVLVSYLFGLAGFLSGLARWFIRETEKRQAEPFASLERLMRDASDKGSRLEREVLEFKVEVPERYVRRDEFIHYQQVVESRLDAIKPYNCVRWQEDKDDRDRTGAPRRVALGVTTSGQQGKALSGQ